MSTLFMIRHGQASFGKNNYDCLSEKGIAQVRKLGSYLQRANIFFDIIFTGTLTRHRQSTEELIKIYEASQRPLPPIQITDKLDEIKSEIILHKLIPVLLKDKVLQKKDVDHMLSNKKAFQNVFETIMLNWINDTYTVDGLPSWVQFKTDVNSALDMIMQSHGKGRKIGIVTSGGPIGIAAQKALYLSDTDSMSLIWQITNSSLTRFKCTSERLMLSTFNEFVHLESDGTDWITYR